MSAIGFAPKLTLVVPCPSPSPCPCPNLLGIPANQRAGERAGARLFGKTSAINAGGFNSRVRLDRFVSPQVDINEAVKIESNVGTVEAVKNELGEREQP